MNNSTNLPNRHQPLHTPPPGDWLPPTFFEQPPLLCARTLIGAWLVWQGQPFRIVETEAYDAQDDAACHTFHRPSARRFVENHPPGTAYVYFNYGMHWLLNVLVKGPQRQGFVLFRALELPENRGAGPGRLTKALGITGADHGRPLCTPPDYGFRSGHSVPILETPRIGISRSTELLWRFVWQGHPAASGPKRRSP